MHAENSDGLFFRRTLNNHGVQILNAPRDFRTAAQNFVELLHFFVQRRGALKIQFLAGLFALLLESSSQGPAAGLKEL